MANIPETSYGTYSETDHHLHDDRKNLDHKNAAPNTGDYDIEGSDTSSVEILTGVSKVEAAQAVWSVFILIRFIGMTH